MGIGGRMDRAAGVRARDREFDPAAAYVAVLETDYGSMEFDLKTKEAPRHVQNFYDLAQQGFYDNTLFHQVIKGVEVRGGDKGMGRLHAGAGDRPGVEAFARDAVDADVRAAAGQRVAVRDHAGSAASYDGQLSIFGQMRSGDDTLTAIENIPTSGQIEAPFYKPVKPIHSGP